MNSLLSHNHSRVRTYTQRKGGGNFLTHYLYFICPDEKPSEFEKGPLFPSTDI